MKKSLSIFLSLGLAGCILFMACSKDDDNTPQQPTVVTKLTKSEWKINSITRPKVSNPASDSIISKACTSDDRILFTTAGAYTFSDGTTKCDTTIFPYSAGTWKYDLTKDTLHLSTTNPTAVHKWKVVTLNDSIFKVQFIDSTIRTDKITKTVIFKH